MKNHDPKCCKCKRHPLQCECIASGYEEEWREQVTTMILDGLRNRTNNE